MPRQSLLTIYKAFIRPHLDYSDIIFDQSYNASFHQKLESFQYNATLAITGAIRDTFQENLFNELGLQPLQNRCWHRNLSCLYKIITNQSPSYLLTLIPRINTAHSAWNPRNIPLLSTNHNFSLTLLFHHSLRNGISLTQIFEAQTAYHIQKTFIKFYNTITK